MAGLVVSTMAVRTPVVVNRVALGSAVVLLATLPNRALVRPVVVVFLRVGRVRRVVNLLAAARAAVPAGNLALHLAANLVVTGRAVVPVANLVPRVVVGVELDDVALAMEEESDARAMAHPGKTPTKRIETMPQDCCRHSERR
jgi:hypothetical protein